MSRTNCIQIWDMVRLHTSGSAKTWDEGRVILFSSDVPQHMANIRYPAKKKNLAGY